MQINSCTRTLHTHRAEKYTKLFPWQKNKNRNDPKVSVCVGWFFSCGKRVGRVFEPKKYLITILYPLFFIVLSVKSSLCF